MTEIPIKKKGSKVRIYVDTLFFTLMILVLIPQTTGIPIHEWASFIIILPFFLHLIINWKWIVTSTTKFLKRQPSKTHFDYVLNWLLYFLMITVTVSGIVISESALPVFGIHFEPDSFWSTIHDISAMLFMAVFGIHIALHWKWIVATFTKLKLKSDFHHLTEISTIVSNHSRQLLLLVIVSTALSFVVWGLNSTEWADGFRISSSTQSSGESGNSPASWMIYVLPLVKVAVIMTIPALITKGVSRIKRIVIEKASAL